MKSSPVYRYTKDHIGDRHYDDFCREKDALGWKNSYNMWSPLRARLQKEERLLHPFVPFEALENPKTLNCDRDSQDDVWFADAGACIVRSQCLENMEDGLLPFK